MLSLPVGPVGNSSGLPDEAPLNTPLATTLGQAAYDVLPDVWFGNTRGTKIQFNAPLISVTAPPSAAPGLVNVKAVEPDGWFAIEPQSFSYGAQILFGGGNAGSTQGGASLALVGYGLIGASGAPTATIGGQPAKVTAYSKYVDFNDSVYNSLYPFSDMDELILTVPPGSPGKADITVTSSAGTATLSNAFNYLSVADYSSSDTFTYILYDPKRHWVYLSAGNHIDVFSADSDQFLTPFVPPSLSVSRQIMGLALTPDNSTLLAADFTDSSVAIIDPDNPAISKAVPIPVSIANNTPAVADVVATSTGEAFVDGTSPAIGGCLGQLWELNLSTLKATLRTEVTNLGASGNAFSRIATGDQVLIGSGECSPALWNSATDTFMHSLALVNDSRAASGDGHWFASDYTRLDSNMVENIQAQTPEFFGNLTFADLSGEKMNASGSLLYTPVPQGNGTAESNGIKITDTNLGQEAGHILLAEQLPQLPQNLMDFDEAGNRMFLITTKGLTVVGLSSPPLSVGYLGPASGPLSGGTTVTIRGSGFQSGASVSLGGMKSSTTFVDSSTLQFVTPAGPQGGARLVVQNPDGTSYALDAGFTYE